MEDNSLSVNINMEKVKNFAAGVGFALGYMEGIGKELSVEEKEKFVDQFENELRDRVEVNPENE